MPLIAYSLVLVMLTSMNVRVRKKSGLDGFFNVFSKVLPLSWYLISSILMSILLLCVENIWRFSHFRRSVPVSNPLTTDISLLLVTSCPRYLNLYLAFNSSIIWSLIPISAIITTTFDIQGQLSIYFRILLIYCQLSLGAVRSVLVFDLVWHASLLSNFCLLVFFIHFPNSYLVFSMIVDGVLFSLFVLYCSIAQCTALFPFLFY